MTDSSESDSLTAQKTDKTAQMIIVKVINITSKREAIFIQNVEISNMYSSTDVNGTPSYNTFYNTSVNILINPNNLSIFSNDIFFTDENETMTK